jgi:nucleotide-binding universal stress UspA family protein
LVPTDFSEVANEAFDYARMLAERFGARVVAVHVQDDSLTGFIKDYPFAAELQEVIELQRKQASTRLAGIAVRGRHAHA